MLTQLRRQYKVMINFCFIVIFQGGTEEKTDDVKPPAAAPAKTLKPTGQLYGSRKF